VADVGCGPGHVAPLPARARYQSRRS
jgi:hypothetical protein